MGARGREECEIVLFLYVAIENSSFSFIYFGTTQPQTECRLNFQNNFCGEGFGQNWMIL